LLTPYVERCLLALVPEQTFRSRSSAINIWTVAIAAHAPLRSLSARAVSSDAQMENLRACDGRNVSASHCGDLTMAIAGHAPVGCDLELVTTRPSETWSDMLGVERFKLAELISRETQETLDVAATRVWTSVECLKKAGAGVNAPLVFVSASPHGWILLASGELKIASGVIQRESAQDDLAVALLTGGGDARV
jgi:enediyne polyketide synthase